MAAGADPFDTNRLGRPQAGDTERGKEGEAARQGNLGTMVPPSETLSSLLLPSICSLPHLAIQLNGRSDVVKRIMGILSRKAENALDAMDASKNELQGMLAFEPQFLQAKVSNDADIGLCHSAEVP